MRTSKQFNESIKCNKIYFLLAARPRRRGRLGGRGVGGRSRLCRPLRQRPPPPRWGMALAGTNVTIAAATARWGSMMLACTQAIVFKENWLIGDCWSWYANALVLLKHISWPCWRQWNKLPTCHSVRHSRFRTYLFILHLYSQRNQLVAVAVPMPFFSWNMSAGPVEGNEISCQRAISWVKHNRFWTYLFILRTYSMRSRFKTFVFFKIFSCFVLGSIFLAPLLFVPWTNKFMAFICPMNAMNRASWYISGEKGRKCIFKSDCVKEF